MKYNKASFRKQKRGINSKKIQKKKRKKETTRRSPVSLDPALLAALLGESVPPLGLGLLERKVNRARTHNPLALLCVRQRCARPAAARMRWRQQRSEISLCSQTRPAKQRAAERRAASVTHLDVQLVEELGLGRVHLFVWRRQTSVCVCE